MKFKKNGSWGVLRRCKNSLMRLFFGALLSSLVACGGSDNASGGAGAAGTSTSTVNTLAPSIAMSATGPVMPFQVVSVKVVNLNLQDSSYTALVDQNPVTLVPTLDKALNWIVPNLAPGQHVLVLNIDGQTVSTNFSVVAGASVANADEYVSGVASDNLASLDNEIAKINGIAGQEAALQDLQRVRTNFATQVGAFANLSQDQKQWLANYLNSNLAAIESVEATPATKFGSTRAKAQSLTLGGFNEQECENHAKLFSISVIRTIKFTHIIGALSTYELMLASQPELAAVVAGFTFGSFAVSLKSTLNLESEVLNRCVGKLGSDTLSSLGEAAPQRVTYLVSKAIAPRALSSNTSSALSFVDNQAQSFDIVTTLSILNASVKSSVESLKSAIIPISSILPPDWLPESWVAQIQSTTTENDTVIADPATYSIGRISDSNIFASTQIEGKVINLKFKVLSPKLVDTSFTFELIDRRDGVVTNYRAVLKGSIPVLGISPVDLSVELGKTYQLVASAKDANGTAIELPPGLIWKSTSPSVISISISGKITGVSKGTSEISVIDPYSNAVSPSVTLSTFAVVFSVSPSTATIGIPQTFTVTGRNLPNDTFLNINNCGNVIVEPGGASMARQFTCTPSALGENSGAISSPALVSDFLYSVRFTDEILSIDEKYTDIALKSNKRLTASAADQYGHPISLPLTLVWSSSDESIATVSSDGLVQGVGFGSAVITVSDPTSKASASSQVKIGCLLGASYCNKELNWVPGQSRDHWSEVSNYCLNLAEYGITGWRLPTAAEVRNYILIDQHIVLSYAWTSTPGPITTGTPNQGQPGHLGVIGRYDMPFDYTAGFEDDNPQFNMISFCVKAF